MQQERKNRYGILHGYFPGENTDLSAESIGRLEYMHAIAITDDAFAVNKTLGELKLSKRRVEVMGLRRNDNEIDHPTEETLIQAQDILIIRGKPRQVERTERYLLEGD